MEKRCKYCGKIIIKEYEKWLEENQNSEYIQCSYCFNLEKIK